jgi:ribose transport system substrate-binding protein
MKATDPKRRLLAIPVILMILAAALGLAACGSSSSSSSAGSTSTTGSTSEEAATTAEGGESPFENVDPTKAYAPGVPTLEELRTEGSESKPPSSGPPAKKNVSAIFVSCGFESPGCRVLAEEGKSAAEALGWKYQIIDGKNSTEGWIAGVRAAIAAKPDIIITNGMACPEVVEALKEAKEAGIPTLGLWGTPCNEPLYGEESAEPGFTVPMLYNEKFESTEDYYHAWGAIEAQYLVDATEGEGKMILAPYAPAYGKSMLEAWETEIGKCKACEILDTVSWVNTEQANGFTAKFETALVQYPEADAALFPFDSTAVNAGGAKAIVDAGRKDKMVSNCGEGGAEAQDLIRNGGGLTGCAAGMDLKWLAWAGLDEANRALQGEESVPEGVGFHVVDETNLSTPGKGVESPVEYVKAYEKNWKG